MAFIRLYEPGDFDAMAHICRATLPPSLAASPDAVRLAPYLWTHQYTHLSPSTCFVLDNGSGTAVGYCIGCPNIPAFCSAYGSYIVDILDKSTDIGERPNMNADEEPWLKPDGTVNGANLLQTAYSAQRLFKSEMATAATHSDITLHIDILPGWQGKGWGRRLLSKTLESFSRERGGGGTGTSGTYVGIAGENSKVVGFYESMGFRVCDELSNDGTIYMARGPWNESDKV